MRVIDKFSGYNSRRYGRPWICKITAWSVGVRPEVEWGRYVGDDTGGEVEIEAAAGDIVRTGRKDHRGNNTSAKWYIVQSDGSLLGTDAAGARQAWDDHQADRALESMPTDLTTVSDNDLIAEVRRRGLTL